MTSAVQYTQTDLYDLLKILNLPVRMLNNDMNYWFVRTESGKYYEDLGTIPLLAIYTDKMKRKGSSIYDRSSRKILQ